MLRLFALLPVAAATTANPIRRVVTLMQNMQKEIEEEGRKEEELFKKFMCYCKTNDGQLGEDASKAQAEIQAKNAEAEKKSGEKKRTEEELAQHKKDRKDAQKALAEATAVRKKERAAYETAAGDTKDYIAATEKAVAALKAGKAGAFLQTSTAGVIRNLVNSAQASMLDSNDSATIMAFLEQGHDYIPQSGEIIGILSNMLDEFKKSLGAIQTSEDEALANFKTLKAAKHEEIAAATSSIEKKTELKGKLAVEIVQAKAAADAAAKELSDAEAFLANLKQMCSTKEADWEARSKERSEEVAAINEAIAVLNDDDSLDVFKGAITPKEAPKSFLQLKNAKAAPAVRALNRLNSMKFKNPTLMLIANTASSKLRSKTGVDFSAVLKMIDEMVVILKAEAKSDEEARVTGEEELRNSASEKKETEQKIAALGVQIEELESGIAAKQETNKEKHHEVKDLDKSVKEASEQRKEENTAFIEEMSLNHSAVQLIEKAKNRLNKFYNPGQYQAPKQRELTEEERILQGAGQDIGDTTAESTIAGTTQTTTLGLAQKAPPPPPETYGEFKRKNQKSNSVIALMDMIVNDLNKESQAAEHEEKTAQRDYETLLADAKAERAALVKEIADNEVAIADMGASLEEAKSGKTSSEEQLTEINQQIADLHAQYDFIIAHFDERAQARETEIDGLGKAKAILSGADYS